MHGSMNVRFVFRHVLMQSSEASHFNSQTYYFSPFFIHVANLKR